MNFFQYGEYMQELNRTWPKLFATHSVTLSRSDYTLFYAGIGISAAIVFILILVNCLFASFGPWRKYWLSRFTGNRYVFFNMK